MNSQKIIHIIPILVSYAFILLFVYAAVSKIIDFENFQAQLGQSSLISSSASVLSYAVPILELCIAVALLFSFTRLYALYATFSLMTLFSSYIAIMLLFSDNIPCSCGGILDKMGWSEHLIFNLCFLLLATFTIIFSPSKGVIKSNMIVRRSIALLVIALFSTAFIILLYTNSEKGRHFANPFQRHFINQGAELLKQTQLHTPTLYIAGTDGENIFLGDRRAPLHVFEVDTLLNIRNQYKISISDENFNFQRIQIKIAGQHFMVVDGTVPVIFKGNINDWRAKTIKIKSTAFFTHIEVLSDKKLVFRNYLPDKKLTVLGTFNTQNDSSITELSPDLLEKQIDGLFDVDGIMQVDRITGHLVYLYFYRNQFLVSNNKLELISRNTTIDTNRHANIKVSINKQTGKQQLSSPPRIVNNLMTVNNNRVFINSKVPGRFENMEMWEKAAVVDVYEITNHKYLGSFYIEDIGEFKAKDMFVINSSLYILGGKKINKYRLNKILIK